LSAILTANDVPQSAIDWMAANGCNTLKKLANWTESVATIKDDLLDLTPAKDSRPALASLRQSWREAEALVARGVKRGAEGLPDEASDDPLPQAVQDALEQAFSKKYSWQLEPRWSPCDSLLGRIKREFERQSVTLFAVARVRSLTTTSKSGEAKRTRLSDKIYLAEEDDAVTLDNPLGEDTLRHRLYQLQIMANAWSIVGCREITVAAGSPTIYCHWQDACKYVQEMRDRTEHLCGSFDESSIVSYFTRCEETIRAAAIELHRKDKKADLPWGPTVIEAMRTKNYIWSETKDLLRRRSSSSSGGQAQRGMAPPPGELGLRSVPKASSAPPPTAKAKPGTAKTLPDGKIICKKFNDARGCTSTCPSGHSHVCDILISTTNGARACGARHSRRKHDAVKDGHPVPRS
jgi:hypothetical protein